MEISGQTLRDRFKAFAESGITWGAIGALMGAITVLVPVLALKWVFVGAGVLLFLRILLADFFCGKGRIQKTFGSMALGLVVAASLIGLWRIIPKAKEPPSPQEMAKLTAQEIIRLMPPPQQQEQNTSIPIATKRKIPVRPEDAFAVAVETRIFVPPGGKYGTSYWAGTLAPGGCALESVQAALFIRITNLQKERTLITAYTVEAMGIPLPRIKMNLYNPFLILGKGVLKPSNQISTAAIQMPVPQGGIGSLVTNKLEDAYPAEAVRINAEFLDPQIAGHFLEHKQMVRGWAYFKYPPNSAIFPANLKLNISDETGHTFSYPIPDSGSDQNADALSRKMFLGPTVDLSACSIER